MAERRRAPRIIGHMVVRNEMGRYLARARAHQHDATDGCMVAYDDRSTDQTYEYLRTWGVPTMRRPDDVPSFADDESACRAAAWAYMEQEMEPTTSDWILCLDADEILVGFDPQRRVREQLIQQVSEATADGYGAVSFHVDEVFHVADGWPLIRTDGFWCQIEALRLVRYRPGAMFASRREGGGSVPSGYQSIQATQLNILHYGYATADDRTAKHARYATGTGHNRAHVESILEPAVLRPWEGVLEKVYTK